LRRRSMVSPLGSEGPREHTVRGGCTGGGTFRARGAPWRCIVDPMDPYAPPKVDVLVANKDDMLVQLPGVSRRVTVRGAGALAGVKVLVDGAPAERAGFFGKVKIPADDGSVIEARAQYGLTGLAVVVGNQKYAVGPVNPAWMGVLVFAPISLLAVGGAIGGVLGATGMMLNRSIAASSIGNGAKAGAMIGVFIAALVLMMLVGGLLRMALPSPPS
jgi:hypothetical protein